MQRIPNFKTQCIKLFKYLRNAVSSAGFSSFNCKRESIKSPRFVFVTLLFVSMRAHSVNIAISVQPTKHNILLSI
ncbi:hypothetical protein PUN28_004618 [Cardiocondyla obscurior]|uniref:Uncharacterized protein n=1 Tax=Cardiocondyla obscurior TaxID=286306 RepID=A0AAW2GFP6_9HYME